MNLLKRWPSILSSIILGTIGSKHDSVDGAVVVVVGLTGGALVSIPSRSGMVSTFGFGSITSVESIPVSLPPSPLFGNS